MRLRLLLVPAALLALVACDADGDGLSNGKENKYGTDPDVADSDLDGLTDGEEVHDFDTDPARFDTDGDSYGDGDEVGFGTDPLDDSDRIYTGYWPYNADKDDLSDPGFGQRLAEGRRVPRFVTIDQYGEDVDFYDFSGHGIPVVVDISAEWCGPCRALSSWLDGGPDSMGLSPTYDPVRDAVDNGDLIWVTILAEDYQGNLPEVDDVQSWADDFPNPMIPVLGDNAELGLTSYFNLRFFPSMWTLNEDLELVRGPSSQTWVPGLDAALDLVEGGE